MGVSSLSERGPKGTARSRQTGWGREERPVGVSMGALPPWVTEAVSDGTLKVLQVHTPDLRLAPLRGKDAGIVILHCWNTKTPSNFGPPY